MAEIVLHVGAHRTGTTSVQKYLYKNQQRLRENGIETFFPPATRKTTISLSSNSYPRVLISDENILGTMENNIRKGCLYPDAGERLLRYNSFLGDVQTIYLSIRNTVDWWSSAISFITKYTGTFPDKRQLLNISNSSRKWSEVINDITSVAPNAEIVIREFSWKTDNPKQQLHNVTKWDGWKNTVADKSRNNRRPTTHDMIAAFTQRGEVESLNCLPQEPYFTPFGSAKSKELSQMYFDDIQYIKKIPRVRLLIDLDATHHEG